MTRHHQAAAANTPVAAAAPPWPAVMPAPGAVTGP